MWNSANVAWLNLSKLHCCLVGITTVKVKNLVGGISKFVLARWTVLV